MRMNYRTQKQVIIFFTTFIFLGLALLVFALIFSGKPKPSPPPLTGEESVETPKVVFKDIEVISSNLVAIEGREKIYDIIAEIKNPNLEYGSPSFVYEFVFKDQAGAETKRLSGTSFVLANQTRYLIKQAIRLPADPFSVELNILSQTWKRLAPFESSGLKIGDLKIRRDNELGNTYVSGLVHNRTPYNLREVDINIVLYLPGATGKENIIAAGATNIQLLNRGDTRSFQILWPSILPYVDMDAKVESNFFENDNFIRDYAL